MRYVLDLAEIPTFRERDVPPPSAWRALRGALAASRVTVGGRPVRSPRRRGADQAAAGQAGLKTTRAEVLLGARVTRAGRSSCATRPSPDRPAGARRRAARPRTAVRSDVPSADPTRRPARLPEDVLGRRPTAASRACPSRRAPARSPRPTGTPRGAGHARTTSDGLAAPSPTPRRARRAGVPAPAAFGWGALHALSPGHGKAMVAAYLVGTRGNAARRRGPRRDRHRHAHDRRVRPGLVTLALSAYVLPEQLYPWLNLASGGARRPRRRRGPALAGARAPSRHHHHHHDGHDHHHDHAPSAPWPAGDGRLGRFIPARPRSWSCWPRSPRRRSRSAWR